MQQRHLVWPWVFAAAVGVAAAGAPLPPSIYWLSSPTLGNETLVVAGAGLDGATATLCSSANCTGAINLAHPAAVAWEQSVQLVLPANIQPPVFLRVTAKASAGQGQGQGQGQGPPSATVAINAPELWWATSGRPAAMANGSWQVDARHPSWINASV